MTTFQSSSLFTLVFFHSYLSYSMFNRGRANKTTLLPLIRLQNKAVGTLECDNTKTPVLYSKHKAPDLFKLSVVKFMHPFNSGGLPNHFDNYFTEIASVQKHQTRLLFLCKNTIYLE